MTGIIPTGIETTVTRKQLLDFREAETIFARRAQTVPRRGGVTNQGETDNG